MERRCPAPGCGERITTERFACRVHWYKLPKDLRRRVNRTWRMRLGDPGNPERADEHEAAKAEAIRWLEEHPGA